MDYKTFSHIKSLLRIIRKDEFPKQYRRAFEKMIAALKEKGSEGKHYTRIRRYFGLFELEDWWYLVFRTHKGAGAYLFLRILKEHTELLQKEISEKKLWELVINCRNWVQAESDSDSEEEEPDTEEDTNTAQNKPGPSTGHGWP